ncbi:MAG: Kdo hydroxylase family protein [Zavarzinella sp.]
MEQNFATFDTAQLTQLEHGGLLPLPDSVGKILAQQFSQPLHELPQGRIRAKGLSYDPKTGTVRGTPIPFESEQVDLLHQISQQMIEIVHKLLPAYAAEIIPDRLTWQTHEVANAPHRTNARDDLYHVDNFPTRPSRGMRILRFCLNFDTDVRVFAVSEPFRKLIEFYRNPLKQALKQSNNLSNINSPWWHFGKNRDTNPSDYDLVMGKIHHWMKADLHFQDRCKKYLHRFSAHEGWLFFSDGTAYAHLRGKRLLDHSFFVPQRCLVAPQCSPLALLEACHTQEA